MSEKDYVVKVIKGEGDFLHISCKGYSAKIPKSFIKDNGLKINANKIHIKQELYDNWFKEAFEAEREYERKRKEIYDSFYPNIPLFWKNKEMILKEPRYFSIKTPFYFMGAAYIGASTATLGELLRIWEYEPVFSTKCTKCGGKSLVFNFSGSPLSGTLGLCENICLECGKFGNGSSASRFGGLMQARSKYEPLQPIIENPASYRELVAACKGETYIAESDKENVEFEDNRFFGMMIGNKKYTLNDLLGPEGKAEILDIPQDNHDLKQPIFYNENGKCGYRDNEKGKQILPAVFDEIDDSRSSYLAVTFRGKKGIVTQLGNMLIPFDYDDVYISGNNTFGVKKEGKWQIVDRKNKPKNTEFYDEIKNLSFSMLIAVLQYGKWKFITPNGKEASSLQADEFAWEYPFLQIRINEKWGALQDMNDKLELVLPINFDTTEIESLGLREYYANGSRGVVDQSGKIIVPPNFDKVGNRCNYDYSKRIVGKNKGTDDFVYIPTQYINAVKNNQMGIYDIFGNEKVPVVYDTFGRVTDYEDIIPACLNGKWGYINMENEVISPFIYDKADTFWHYDFAEVVINKKHGLIDRKGNVICPLEYNGIWILDNNLIRIEQNGEMFHIDSTGKVIERYEKNLIPVTSFLRDMEVDYE